MTANDDSGETTDTDTDSDAETDDSPPFEADPERVEQLRAVADDVRGDTSESEQLANILYRTSDLYDPDGETTPEEIIRNVKFILEVNDRGGLER